MQSQKEAYHLLEIRPLSFDQAQIEFPNGQNRMWKKDIDNYGANPLPFFTIPPPRAILRSLLVFASNLPHCMSR